MKSKMSQAFMPLRLSVLAAVIVLTSPVTLAQDPGWYSGFGVGKAWSDIDVGEVVTRLHAAGYNSSLISTYDDDVAAKMFGGYQFNRNFALEAGYFDLGKFNYSVNTVPAALQQGKAKISGLSIDLVGTLPLQDNLSAFARVGINNARIAQRFSNPAMGAGFADHKDRGAHEDYGVGLQFAVNDRFTVRAELERYRLDHNSVTKDSVDTLSLSVVYRFGASKPAPEIAKPAPVAPAPTPAPAPAPAPAAPIKITLAASALFDFDKTVLKAAGKQELDKLLKDIKGVRYEVIIVTGHTDRIGTHGYNQALSERRANVVRSYLVSGGIPSGSITAKGVNSDVPVTTKQQCQGLRSAQLKVCLQPDRRVDIELSGTRDSK